MQCSSQVLECRTFPRRPRQNLKAKTGASPNCINRITQNFGYSVLYFPIYDDPNTVMLELKYRTLSRQDRIPRVRSAQLDNAYVINAKGEKGLYRDCYFKSVDFTRPSLDSQSEFILKRDNPNNKVHVVLNLDNEQSTGLTSTYFRRRCNAIWATITAQYKPTRGRDRGPSKFTHRQIVFDRMNFGVPNRTGCSYF
jgi:hypothetical protein